MHVCKALSAVSGTLKIFYKGELLLFLSNFLHLTAIFPILGHHQLSPELSQPPLDGLSCGRVTPLPPSPCICVYTLWCHVHAQQQCTDKKNGAIVSVLSWTARETYKQLTKSVVAIELEKIYIFQFNQPLACFIFFVNSHETDKSCLSSHLSLPLSDVDAITSF